MRLRVVFPGRPWVHWERVLYGEKLERKLFLIGGRTRNQNWNWGVLGSQRKGVGVVQREGIRSSTSRGPGLVLGNVEGSLRLAHFTI